jgi:hypothetical protein
MRAERNLVVGRKEDSALVLGKWWWLYSFQRRGTTPGRKAFDALFLRYPDLHVQINFPCPTLQIGLDGNFT